jgi:hypothetical protein
MRRRKYTEIQKPRVKGYSLLRIIWRSSEYFMDFQSFGRTTGQIFWENRAPLVSMHASLPAECVNIPLRMEHTICTAAVGLASLSWPSRECCDNLVGRFEASQLAQSLSGHRSTGHTVNARALRHCQETMVLNHTQ